MMGAGEFILNIFETGGEAVAQAGPLFTSRAHWTGLDRHQHHNLQNHQHQLQKNLLIVRA